MSILRKYGLSAIAPAHFLLAMCLAATMTALGIRPADAQVAPPAFTKTFMPDTIGPGSVTTLRFEITNNNPAPIDTVAFTDTLPAGVTIATPANASHTDCSGGGVPTLSAPAGGTTIAFSDGEIGGNATCVITVDVTSATPGTHMNVSSVVTSSAPDSGTAADDLIVEADLPGFAKLFSPSTVPLGGKSTLTFTIDNTANAAAVSSANFVDNLPVGLEIASPANAATNCGNATVPATLTAPAGGTSITFEHFGTIAFPTVGANSSCTVQVDVVATGIGTLANISGDLTATVGFTTTSAGKASAVLTVTSAELHLTKEFTDDPVLAGGAATLEFTINNRERLDSATGVGFTDDLTTALAGLTFDSVLFNDCGGSVGGVGTTDITFSGGTIAPETTCTIRVSLTVPAAALTGSYTNTTGEVSGTVAGNPVTGNIASDTLRVDEALPQLSKSFLTNPVGGGDTVSIEFTITNPSAATVLEDLAFTDDLGAFLSGASISSLPTAGFCGASSSAFTSGFSGEIINITGGEVAAGDSCTFSVDILIPVGAPAGPHLNTTSQITGTANGISVTGPAASDTLNVVGGLQFTKEFTDDPATPGGTATLEFTITNPGENAADATGVAFTDDLGAALSGLVFTSEDSNSCGGSTTGIGTGLISYSGGSLTAGSSCTIVITTTVPAGATPGAYSNTTSELTATISGVAATAPAASDTLLVGGFTFTKEFIDDPVIAGGQVTLRFTLQNDSGSDTTSIFFDDDLRGVLPGATDLTVDSLPGNPVCGGTLSEFPAGALDFSGGALIAGAGCTFDVVLGVPAGTTSDTYNNTTTSLFVDFGGGLVSLPPATDSLTVESGVLLFTKEFTDDPAAPGDTVTLEFTIENTSGAAAADLAFIDDLAAVLPGAPDLEATGAVTNDCGGMGAGFPTSNFSYSGGSLAAGSTCTISLTVDVPAGATPGDYLNTTSDLTGTIGGLAVTGDAASDTLTIADPAAPTFSKAFDGPSVAGGNPVLNFTITNNSATDSISDLSFTDDLDAVITGLAATAFPTNSCGGTISGTTFLNFSGGSLGPSASCVIEATLQVPAGATPGTFPNVTSDLLSAGLKLQDPAAADLIIEPPPTFAKVFAPDTILFGGVSTLTFTIDNSASALAASALDFTDNLPAGVTVATPANASTTCTGGTITAADGTGVISYTGGAVAAGASCTVQADVTSSTAGAHVNTTGDLTSSSGNSGTASDTLNVNQQPPAFAKVFVPDTIDAGAISTLTFTIDNTAGATDAIGLDFTDNLPAAVLVATPSNATTDCTGGTLTAADGSGVISYTGGTVSGGATCTVSVDVTSSTAGAYDNLSGDLTSSLGNSGTASATLNVNFVVPMFSKEFVPDTILTNALTVLTFTIDNTGSLVDANSLDFTDTMPASIVVAPGARTTSDCGGTITAADGTNVIGFTGGTVAAGATCQISIEVQGTVAGIHTNTTDNLTSTSGDSGTATDDLNVTDLAPVFSKLFAPDTIDAGAISTLTFTINNSAGTTDATGLDFTDNLPADVTVATPANATTDCTGGALTAAEGSSVVSYTGGTVAGGASCTISVDVTSSTAGAHDNLTGDLTSSLGNSGKAADTLNVNFVVPLFSKAFVPDTIQAGEISTLTFTIDNSGSLIDANLLDFTDTMPADVTVATPANVANTCTGGTVTATSGTNTIAYSGGTAAAATSCTISIDVTGSTAGSHVNVTGDLTSSLGNSGTATDTLIVNVVAPLFSKAFAPASILVGEVSTLTFTIDNTGSLVEATVLDFTDAMPAAIEVATPANASTTCTGGTITATSGTNTIGYSGGTAAASSSCDVTVDVTGTAAGSHVNVTGDLTSSLGNSGTATDTLDVADPAADLTVTLVDDVDPVVTGNPVAYTATVANGGPQDATNVVATVTLPAGVTFVSTAGCAEDPNGVPTCSLGAIATGANAVFTINVNVDVGTVGIITTTVSAVSDQADPVPADNTASEDTTVELPEGTITIVKNTAPAAAGDGTFEFTSTDPDLDAISLTTVGNTATSVPIAKPAGVFTISEDVTEGWVLDDLACTGDTDGGTVIDLPNREVVIDLDNGETIVCTFTNIRDPIAVIRQTLEAIMEFIEKRADQMTANQPDLVSRLKDRGTPGVAPMEFFGSGTSASSTSRFSTSLHKVKTWHSNLNGEGTGDLPLFDVWVQGFFSHTNTTTSDSHLGMVHLGADYLVNPNLVIGGIVQLDWAGLDSSTSVATVDGFGWMAGPYFVANPWQNIYVDGRVHYGQSYNDINPIGTYTDQFDTERFLATLQVTGDMRFGQLAINPAAELLYFNERQEAYVDTLGNTIPSQTLELGRVIFGPQFSYNMVLDNGGTLTPTAKLEGIWDFHHENSPLATGTVTGVGGLRGRVDVGLGYRSPSGVSVQASGFYDGIGRSGFDAYGGRLEIMVPFHPEE